MIVVSDIKNLYEKWCKFAVKDKDVADELKSIEGDDARINERFYSDLEFGTGGLRGVIGAGTNRLNIYTVNRATQGLADYLKSRYESSSVAIAYDSRIKSDVFARGAAGVLAANGIKVYIYPELVPTPMLSFAVRYLKCQAGIMITASHNPAKYNGYKCYNEYGYQMTDEAAAETYECIKKIDIFSDVKEVDFDNAVSHGKIEIIGSDVFTSFYEEVEKQCDSDVCSSSDIKIIYSPLNGTGNKPVRYMLKRLGFKNVSVVPEQENPDGNFPTCPFPNPEIQQAFEYAIKLSKKEEADLLFATDPDCDRVGIAVNVGDNKFRLLNGNETGALLCDYVLSRKKKDGSLKPDSYLVKTIVTSELITKIGNNYGCKTMNFLTGFKYIGEFVTKLEERGEADKYVLGMEESYGYLAGTHVRDKDAVVASALICEMAAYYKTQGKRLTDVLNGLYEKYGYYKNALLNFQFEGASGMEKMKALMEKMRSNTPKQIASSNVVASLDYLSSRSVETSTGIVKQIDLPKSNVLEYHLENGAMVVVRPSGTEPKIKIYVTACDNSMEKSEETVENISESMKTLLGLN